jgi:hypothetical protein
MQKIQKHNMQWIMGFGTACQKLSYNVIDQAGSDQHELSNRPFPF